MKKFIVAVSAFVLVCVGLCYADTAQDHTISAVNHRNYEFFPDSRMTPAPKGYKPVYILQYARHGARTNTDAGSAKYVMEKLAKAEQAGILSEQGKTMLEAVTRMYNMTKGHEGALLPSGQKEHEMLAQRLYDRYGCVFKKGARNGDTVRVVSTTSPRVLLSMAAFTNRISALEPRTIYGMDSYNTINGVISNGPDQETKDSVKVLVQAVRSRETSSEKLYETLFTDTQRAKEIIPKPMSLESNIYYCACFAKPMGMDHELFFLPLSEDAIHKYWTATVASLYLLNCNSVEFGRRRMKACDPLVKYIVQNADDAMSGSGVCADLIFGHDYPLLALACRMHIADIDYTWSHDRIDPVAFDTRPVISFASNLQMIFFRNRAGEVLVKIIYNDTERQIKGLQAIGGCYYRWADIKSSLLEY